MYHYCILRVIVLCCSLLWFASIIAGWDCGMLPSFRSLHDFWSHESWSLAMRLNESFLWNPCITSHLLKGLETSLHILPTYIKAVQDTRQIFIPLYKSSDKILAVQCRESGKAKDSALLWRSSELAKARTKQGAQKMMQKTLLGNQKRTPGQELPSWGIKVVYS